MSKKLQRLPSLSPNKVCGDPFFRPLSALRSRNGGDRRSRSRTTTCVFRKFRFNRRRARGLPPSVEYGWSERGRLRPSASVVRPSSERLELKFSAVGNAVSLFPKEKYPAARFEAAGNSQLLFILGVPRLAIPFTRSPTPHAAGAPGAFDQLKVSLD